jgi:MFS family permease
MSAPTETVSSSPGTDEAPMPPGGEARPIELPVAAESAYRGEFWFAYLANTSLMVTVSMLFRYSDFVELLGGTELQLGWIVGTGAVGSLLMRVVQGTSIDRQGPRSVWAFSLGLVIVMLLSHLAISRVDGPAIYLVRTAYHTGLAGAFGSSITYISRRVPIARTAEVIGTLGSSGFVGMVLGTQLGDLMCAGRQLARRDLDRLFVVAAALAAFSLCCALRATRGDIKPARRRRLPAVWLVRRYHPGRLLLMGLVMGAGLGMPGTFVRPYAASLGIGRIGLFFGTYAVTAFLVRLATRRLVQQIGVAGTIVTGMASLAGSMLLYLLVGTAWEFAVPAVATGVAHALLFPAVVAGGSLTFPARYRGLGTTLILGSFDLGNLIGMPLAGTVLSGAESLGWAAYPTMFCVMASGVGLTTAYYVLAEIRFGRRKRWAKPPA